MTETISEVINNAIQEYRAEMGFFRATGMTDRDQKNLTAKLAGAVSSALESIDRRQLDQLERELAQVKTELERAKGPGYAEMKNELEGARALAKHLIYRLGKEDSTIEIAIDDLKDMEARVDLRVMEDGGVAKVQVEEFEEA